MIIIPLGEGCNISWNLEKINLRGPSSIFEWFLSVNFQDINHIVNKIIKNQKIKITKRHGIKELERDIFLDDTDIRSAHYDLYNFSEILDRRVKRFREQIMSNEKILFIREEHNAYFTQKEDIDAFKKLINECNPNCNYKILLLMPFEIKREPLQIDGVFHKETLRDQFNLLQYIQEIEKSF